ncbi:MAG: hypothetical protein ACR2HE_04730 [Casimicrobiaceae bacterium]
MPALLDRFRAAGIELVPYDDGTKLRAFGELTDELRQAIRASRPAILAELAVATHFRWGVRYSGGRCLEVRVLLGQDRRYMTARYPDATVEPLPATEGDE